MVKEIAQGVGGLPCLLLTRVLVTKPALLNIIIDQTYPICMMETLCCRLFFNRGAPERGKGVYNFFVVCLLQFQLWNHTGRYSGLISGYAQDIPMVMRYWGVIWESNLSHLSQGIIPTNSAIALASVPQFLRSTWKIIN